MNDNTEQTRYATFADFLDDYADMVWEEPGEDWYAIRYTASGDYVGGFAEEANRKVLLEDCPSIVDVYDGFDYAVAVIDPEHFSDWDSGELETLCDCLDSLEVYPVLSDDLWIELKDEARWAVWDEEQPYVLRAIVDRTKDMCDAGYTVDAERLLSDWLKTADGDWWWDIVIVEGKSVWVDTDNLVDIVVSDYGDKLGEYVILEPWNDPTRPEFHAPEAVGKRAAIHNAKAQAERHREMGLPTALGEDDE